MEPTRKRLFGTDGVRGIANTELTTDVAMALARAASRGIEGPVVIGRDTRRSGPMLSSAVAAGFNSVGVDTVDLGIIPVGGVSRLVRDSGASLGVMVSASHNPAEDNGIKFFGRDGAKLSEDQEAAIETAYHSNEVLPRGVGAGVGIQTQMTDALDRYIDKIAASAEYSMQGLEFVVDCANGAAFAAAPRLFERVGADVSVFADMPDGLNINDGVGATHPETVAKLARGKVGFAFDGDADRLIAVDESGQVCDGDVIMAIFAKWQHDRGKLNKDTVVATVMSNLGFHQAMKRLGITVLVTPVGDRNVVEEMRRTQAVVGGEQSGHILLEDRSTGDGLRTALRLMEVMASTGEPLTELRKVMTQLPQVLLNVRVPSKDGWESDEDIMRAIKDAERSLGPRGRVLVRPSGTEPLIRVMVEAPTSGEATTVAESIADAVTRSLS